MDNNIPQLEDKEALNKLSGSDDPLCTRWLAEIKLYEDKFKKYNEDCKGISDRYRDDRENNKGRYNIFWSQVENLKPAVLYYLPKVEVARRFKDKDPLARAGGEILERATQYNLEDNYTFNKLEKCRDDYIMYARGQAWVRYQPLIEKTTVQVPAQIDPMSGMPQEGAQMGPDGRFYITEEQEVVTKEEVIVDYLHRLDFGHSLARVWEEVKAVWRKSYLTREECVERFGEEIGKKIPLNNCPKELESANELTKDLFLKAEIYEIWDKEEKKVIWLTKALPTQVLDVRADPLNLKGFFPCPRPAFGSLDTESLVPIPDYNQYKTIAEQLDQITARITSIERAIKAVAVYDASKDSISKISNAKMDLTLIPVENWAAFGGLDKVIEWLPMRDLVDVLQNLFTVKNAYKQDLYEISGISDIIRGQTDPRETATAQRTKAQFASERLRYKQKVFSIFCRDLIEIMAEVIAEHFDPEILGAIAGVQSMGPEIEQAMPQIVELLRSDRARCYRIDIQTDSTIAIDEQANQEQVVQFMNMFTQGLNDILPVIQAFPMMTPMLTESLLMVARRFKAGRNLEGAIENAFSQLGAPPPAPEPQEQQQPPPQEQQGIDARIIASQNEMQYRQAQLQQDAALKGAQLQLDRERMESNLAVEAAKLKQKKDESNNKIILEATKAGRNILMPSIDNS
jgi:hypothetical protein